MIKENDENPLDIILYNLVKYFPSPINKSIYLSFGVELTNAIKAWLILLLQLVNEETNFKMYGLILMILKRFKKFFSWY